MNLLITGALGHIGSQLINKIYKLKNLKNVYLVDSARSNNLNVLFNLKKKKFKIKFFNKDLIDSRFLKSIKKKIHVVVHLAAITNAADSFKNKRIIYSNNYGIFKNIVKFCIQNNAKLIHISSTSVYGLSSSLVDESCSNLKPQSPYADEKLMEEIYLNKNKKKIKFITLRFGTIAGISKGMRFHTAVNKFCFNTILNEEIPIWSNAIDQYRPYLSLNDAINVIIFIIKNKIFDNEIYNVLTKNYTVRQILDLIQKNNFKIRVKYTNSPILNQNSYKVSRKKFDKFKVNFSKNINNDIRNTLNLLKGLS